MTTKGVGKSVRSKAAPSSTRDKVSGSKDRLIHPTKGGQGVPAKEAVPNDTKIRQPARLRELRRQAASTAEKHPPKAGGHIPNVTTVRAIREADVGKNMTRYKNAEEMVKDLGS
jgi:hypothetical protein